jgi:hypothetical protein
MPVVEIEMVEEPAELYRKLGMGTKTTWLKKWARTPASCWRSWRALASSDPLYAGSVSARTSSLAVFGSLLVLVSCEGGGTKETLDTLRAQHLEIIDGKGATTMDVNDRIHALEERIQKLEAEMARRDAQPAPASAPVPSPSATPDSGTTVAPAHAKPARPGSPLEQELRQ